MFVTIFLGVFSVLFAYLVKYKNVQWGLKASFILIFLFLALRYNFGNDYKGYFRVFYYNFIDSSFDLFDEKNQFEPGWMFLNYIFQPFGFFVMVAFLAGFHCLVFYRFIKRYVPKDYYWLAIFLYVFNPGFLLILSSAMRQTVAITLFIISIDYLYKKDAIRYFLFIGLASLFHSSALLLLPVYLLSFVNVRIKWVSGILILSVFTSVFLFKDFFASYVNQLIISYFERYEVYEGAAEFGTGLGFLYTLMLFILILIYDRFQIKEKALIFKLAILSILIIPFGFIINMIGRVSMYFAPATLIVYPIICRNIRKGYYKLIYIVLIVFMTLYSFYGFFNSEIWRDDFGTYQTIFTAPHRY